MTLLTHSVVLTTALYCLTIVLFIIGMSFKKNYCSAAKPRVTVIIAARNEEANIGGILGDLSQQDYPADRFEVIVADDHSTDGTARLVNDWAEKCPAIRLLTVGELPPRFSPKKFAIQQAAAQAAGEIILATDADCRVGPEWISAMVEQFDERIGFVIGFSQFGRRGHRQNLIERLQALDFVMLMGAACGSANWGVPLAASGQNMAYRKRLFDQVGGYRQVAHRVSGDDVLLLQLIHRKTGCRAAFAADPRAHAVSEPQPTLMGLINQRKRWASNGAYQLLLNPVFFAYLALVFSFNAALLIGLPAALITGRGLATIGGGMAARLVFEGMMTVRSALFFRRGDLIKYFPLWFMLQMPYIVSVGLWGTFGKFTWKNRVHNAQTR